MARNKKKIVTDKVIPLYMDSSFFFERGLKFLERTAFDQALKCFKKAMEYDPSNVPNVYMVATMLTETGQFHESNHLLNHLLDDLDADLTECYFYMANNFAHMDNFEAAYRTLRHYMKHDKELQYIEEAEELMEIIEYELHKQPSSTKEWIEGEEMFEYERARLLMESEKFHDAIALLEKIIKQQPDFYPAYNELSLAYFQMNQPQEGLRVVEELLRIDSYNIHGLCNLVLYYMHSGEMHKVSSAVSFLLKLVPMDEKYVYKLAWTLGTIGYNKEALYHYQRLLKKPQSANDIQLHFFCGIAAFNSQNDVLASQMWQKTLKIDPDCMIAQFYMHVLHMMQQNPRPYERYALKFHTSLPFEDMFARLNKEAKKPSFALATFIDHEPLFLPLFEWGMEKGNPVLQCHVIEAYGKLESEYVFKRLRQMAEETHREEEVRRFIYFILCIYDFDIPPCKKYTDPMHKYTEKEQLCAALQATCKWPKWDEKWSILFGKSYAYSRFKPIEFHYFYDMMKLIFAVADHAQCPRIVKEDGWIAAFYYIITHIKYREPVTYDEVAQLFGVSSPTVSKNVKILFPIVRSIAVHKEGKDRNVIEMTAWQSPQA